DNRVMLLTVARALSRFIEAGQGGNGGEGKSAAPPISNRRFRLGAMLAGFPGFKPGGIKGLHTVSFACTIADFACFTNQFFNRISIWQILHKLASAPARRSSSARTT